MHSHDTSEQTGSRWERGGEEERERESVKGTTVPKCNNIKKKIKDRTLILHSRLIPCSKRGGQGCSPP